MEEYVSEEIALEKSMLGEWEYCPFEELPEQFKKEFLEIINED